MKGEKQLPILCINAWCEIKTFFRLTRVIPHTAEVWLVVWQWLEEEVQVWPVSSAVWMRGLSLSALKAVMTSVVCGGLRWVTLCAGWISGNEYFLSLPVFLVVVYCRRIPSKTGPASTTLSSSTPPRRWCVSVIFPSLHTSPTSCTTPLSWTTFGCMLITSSSPNTYVSMWGSFTHFLHRILFLCP